MCRTILIALALLGSLLTAAQAQTVDPNIRGGAQYATYGTDFWVCFPRTVSGQSVQHNSLYVVSERDCDVTVSNPLFDYSQTVHIMHRSLCGPDTNYITIPLEYSRITDTLFYDMYNLSPRLDYRGRAFDQPQPRAFHVTSTDTISLFIQIFAAGVSDITNVLPTHLLRDEYVCQLYPKVEEGKHTPSYYAYTSDFDRPPNHYTSLTSDQFAETIQILAVEDSTVVDIVLTDWDLANRRPGDTITVTLRPGQLYNIQGGSLFEKYAPLFPPYWYYPDGVTAAPQVSSHLDPITPCHTFVADSMGLDTFVIDLSGTRIRSHDCKPIAVFQGGGRVFLPQFFTACSDMVFEQVVPTCFTGTEFFVPHFYNSDTVIVRFTGLHDNTRIQIFDAASFNVDFRTIYVDAYKANWFEMRQGEGPFYIRTSQPTIVMAYSSRDHNKNSDEAGCLITPVEWWHHGPIIYGTVTDVDANNNRQARDVGLYLYSRTADVPDLRIDDYHVENHFSSIPGTQYSYATFPAGSSFNSEGTHVIKSLGNHPFMAHASSTAYEVAALYNLPHFQPTGTFLTLNGIPHTSLNPDSIWCLYDPITFLATNRRPADSVFWDFGDGTTLAIGLHDTAYLTPKRHLYRDTGRYHVQVVYTYLDEGCFTISNDTLRATVWLHNRYDTSIFVRQCEGSYTFRDHEYNVSDTFTLVVPWTASGCDTLFHIDLVTCPHCHWVYDTVGLDDLPVTYNGRRFDTETTEFPIRLDIGDTCDSIIYYTLTVIPYWGEPPIDSIWISAPNVFTPDLGTNNRFQLRCNRHIRSAEVVVYDRRGDLVARFDGLTQSWDGTSHGAPCPQGTYVYHVRYIDSADLGAKTFAGTVTLLR